MRHLKILALEPYFGGSHQAFLAGWSRRSRHAWTVLTLPAHKWKWRMRHAAVTMAEQVRARCSEGVSWDALFCSDMLNLAEFLGLAPAVMRSMPSVVYFHENQLTYPVQRADERDLHFGFTHLTTALASDAVWFNSAFHRDAFLDALDALARRMPDYQPVDAIETIRNKSTVQPPGIDVPAPRGPRAKGPLHILWAARWEHDKRPEDFFTALRIVKRSGVPFRLSVVGEQFARTPPVFAEAQREFAGQIDVWGYQDTRADYLACLGRADVVVSTAAHEFFGMAVLEAAAAGAWPVLPRRLAYPEIFGGIRPSTDEQVFYDGSVDALAERLAKLAATPITADAHAGLRDRIMQYEWDLRAAAMDMAISRHAERG